MGATSPERIPPGVAGLSDDAEAETPPISLRVCALIAFASRKRSSDIACLSAAKTLTATNPQTPHAPVTAAPIVIINATDADAISPLIPKLLIANRQRDGRPPYRGLSSHT